MPLPPARGLRWCFFLTLPLLSSSAQTPHHAVANAPVHALITLPTLPSPTPTPPHVAAHTVAHAAVLANATDVANAVHVSFPHQHRHTPPPVFDTSTDVALSHADGTTRCRPHCRFFLTLTTLTTTPTPPPFSNAANIAKAAHAVAAGGAEPCFPNSSLSRWQRTERPSSW